MSSFDIRVNFIIYINVHIIRCNCNYTGSPYNPQTPGAGLDTGVGSGVIGGSEWHTTDIEVRIRDSHDDPALAGQQAVIRGISVNLFYTIIKNNEIFNNIYIS